MACDTYPHWLFDASPIDDPFGYGERAVKFIRALKHPKTGREFQLDRWQERLVRRIYGPRHADGTRIVRQVIMLVSRGARKTTLGAALALLHTVGHEKVANGQVFLAAYDREQARIAYQEAHGMVTSHPKIKAATKILDYRHEIRHSKSRATIKAVSSDANASNGLTPAFALIDEIHAWKKRELLDVLRTGLSKTAGTLCLIISQAGRGQESVASEVYDYARKVARGEIEDPGTLPILFETPADADWRDETVWHKANPGLALGYPDLPSLRQMAREAENRPALREKFRNDHLGVWLDSQQDPWIDSLIWDECAAAIPLEERGKEESCWLGVDLGSTSDLTAVVAAFRDQDDGFSLYPFVFAPEDSLRPRQDRGEAPYVRWKEAGYLIATPGNVTDWDFVESKIRELCERFNVQEIAADPWGARLMLSRLTDDGLPTMEHRQGFVSMSAPMKSFERAALAKKLRHDGNSILQWCVANVVVDQDPAGNIKPNKSKSREKIDVAVAGIMALGRAEMNEGGCVYMDVNARPNGILFI
ncbi:terminase [Methylosinus sp. R-45379]|uniref:terminase large subunit n=1 Tax=Methylosinus sp. R-45379 TaxID=980563 RepID=UPI0007C931A1|nr:terminase TerL endonuclease subunit [Methylosinus sp. R-45379]OAI26948.1 terminase [Methylosinus sp. R-45379]